MSGGVATITTTNLSVGTHNILAAYSGDGNFGSSSGTLTQTVNSASTTTSLSSNPNPSTVGQSVTFTATVTVMAPGAGTPSGVVSFTDTISGFLGTGTLSSGVVTFNTSSLSVGSHLITATYGGNTNYTGSVSNVVTQVVVITPVPVLTVAPAALTFTSTVGGANPASQTVTLTATNGPITYTTSVSGALSVTVSPVSGTVNPGTNQPVTISVNSTGLAAGTYTATVTFQDTNNLADKATVNVTLTVTAGPPPPPVYTYYLPFLANNYAPGAPITGTFTSYLAVQNAGSGAANATISYFDSAGVTLTASTVVTTIAQYGEILPANPFASGAKGAGVIISNQPLNVIVAEATPFGGTAYAVNQDA